MKSEHISGSLRLSVHDYEQDELNAIVREQINPCSVPSGITFDKFLSEGFPVRFAESSHIPVPPVLSQFTFPVHIHPHTRGHSRQQDSPSPWMAATRVQLAAPSIGHRVGPCDRPFLNTSLV